MKISTTILSELTGTKPIKWNSCKIEPDKTKVVISLNLFEGLVDMVEVLYWIEKENSWCTVFERGTIPLELYELSQILGFWMYEEDFLKGLKNDPCSS